MTSLRSSACRRGAPLLSRVLTRSADIVTFSRSRAELRGRIPTDWPFQSRETKNGLVRSPFEEWGNSNQSLFFADLVNLLSIVFNDFAGRRVDFHLQFLAIRCLDIEFIGRIAVGFDLVFGLDDLAGMLFQSDLLGRVRCWETGCART